MSNRLLPYDTIIKAHEGDPIAIQAVLDRYAGYIRYFSNMNGYYNSDMEDYGAAEQYLTFEHDEFTMKPTLDEAGGTNKAAVRQVEKPQGGYG